MAVLARLIRTTAVTADPDLGAGTAAPGPRSAPLTPALKPAPPARTAEAALPAPGGRPRPGARGRPTGPRPGSARLLGSGAAPPGARPAGLCPWPDDSAFAERPAPGRCPLPPPVVRVCRTVRRTARGARPRGGRTPVVRCAASRPREAKSVTRGEDEG
ncbi:hypothetical protein GCM10010327_17820 [Streptomyces nitrosporeus]|nr:hypothetical protein GCM10010327_17820 [Streptomyces nitrosporeus]